MSRPIFLTLEELVNEVMDDRAEDESENEDVFHSETETENKLSECDLPESDLSEHDSNVDSHSRVDLSFVAKDGTIWSNMHYTRSGLGKENVINLRPGS